MTSWIAREKVHDDITLVSPLFTTETVYPTSARELICDRCDVHLACRLNSLWHSRFPKIDWSNVVRNRHYCCFAAHYGGRFYAVAIWSSPIAANRLADGDKLLELRRMAIAKEAPRFTATRMLSIMRKQIRCGFPDVIRLISYQDTEVHSGTIYKAAGWTAAATNTGESWSVSRRRSPDQSLAPKVRWELQLKGRT